MAGLGVDPDDLVLDVLRLVDQQLLERVLLMSWASSSRPGPPAPCVGGITVLAWVMLVKVNASMASMTPPASASRMTTRTCAEFTPAASLIRSSEMGARV